MWNDKPQKSLAELAFGEADLSGDSNRTVTGKAAFCGCYLALLIGNSGCFLCFLSCCVCIATSACDTLLFYKEL